MDHYTAPTTKALATCVNGANALSDTLSTHEDETDNFKVLKLVSADATPVTRQTLVDWIGDLLFADQGPESDLLFFFSGHGRITSLGPELVTEEVSGETSGVSMDQIAAAANRTKFRSLTIVLDCCNAGAIGQLAPGDFGLVQLAKGSALLAATSDTESAFEGQVEQSWFTSALLQGLNGAAADLGGRVTPAGLHSLAESALIGTRQDPVLKVYSDSSHVLRRCIPTLSREQLRGLKNLFGDHEVPPSVSRDLALALKSPSAVSEEGLSIQAMIRQGLITMERASSTGNIVKLTLSRLGVHYWRLALEGVFDAEEAAPL